MQVLNSRQGPIAAHGDGASSWNSAIPCRIAAVGATACGLCLALALCVLPYHTYGLHWRRQVRISVPDPPAYVCCHTIPMACIGAGRCGYPCLIPQLGWSGISHPCTCICPRSFACTHCIHCLECTPCPSVKVVHFRDVGSHTRQRKRT